MTHVNVDLDGWEPEEGFWTVEAGMALSKPCPKASPAPKFRSAGLYVAHCRRAHPAVFGDDSPARGGCLPNGEDAPDGRLIAEGWNKLSPTKWAEQFQSFSQYWEKAAPLASVVGSDSNPSPDLAFAAWRKGVPPWLVAPLGDRLRNRSGRLRGWGRLPRRARRRLVFAAIALRRASARLWRVDPATGWSMRWSDHVDLGAAALLGRLDPEEQTALLEAAHALLGQAEREDAPVRARDLVPAARTAGRIFKALRSTNEWPVRVALAIRPDGYVGRRARQLGYAGETLAPAYPYVPLTVARRLCLGESPRQIADGVLTAREAHRWCAAGADDVAEWLQQELLGGMAEVPALRDAKIVRWLAAVKRRGGWGQLVKERPLHLPAGETASWRPIDRIDEIQIEDLARGERTSVDAAFESAAVRQADEWAAKAREDQRVLKPLPGSWRPFKCMRHLNTPALLEREGREAQNCVGGYANAVERGESVIFSITLPRKGVRSTVELTPTGRVLQHWGPQNRDPHPALERVLRSFLERRIDRPTAY